MAEELKNPIFEDEREFLERKKQEYERALRGDVDHIKNQGAQVGKVALVGAGLAGSVWLISKIFGGKGKAKSKAKNKNKNHSEADSSAGHAQSQDRHDTYLDFDDDNFDLDDEAFSIDRSAEGRRHDNQDHSDFAHEEGHDEYSSGTSSARESAQAFMAHGDDEHEQQSADFFNHDDNLDEGFGNGFDHAAPHADLPAGRLDFGPAMHLHKQGAETSPARAYDDSRRLPKSTGFSAEQAEKPAANDVETSWPATQPKTLFGQRAAEMAILFLGTNTGKAVAAQATAVVLAYVSKKMNDRLPVSTTGKNADLANAPATTSFYAATPPAPDSSPAVSLTYTDAPTEHPTS